MIPGYSPLYRGHQGIVNIPIDHKHRCNEGIDCLKIKREARGF